MIRIETKRSLRRQVHRQAPVMPSLGTESEDLAPLTEIQERTLRRTQLLKLKAEAELERLEKSPPPDAAADAETIRRNDDPQDAGAAKPKPVDPKQIKAGLSEGDRAGAASGRADGTGGQVAQAEGSSGCLPAGRRGA